MLRLRDTRYEWCTSILPARDPKQQYNFLEEIPIQDLYGSSAYKTSLEALYMRSLNKVSAKDICEGSLYKTSVQGKHTTSLQKSRIQELNERSCTSTRPLQEISRRLAHVPIEHGRKRTGETKSQYTISVGNLV